MNAPDTQAKEDFQDHHDDNDDDDDDDDDGGGGGGDDEGDDDHDVTCVWQVLPGGGAVRGQAQRRQAPAGHPAAE